MSTRKEEGISRRKFITGAAVGAAALAGSAALAGCNQSSSSSASSGSSGEKTDGIKWDEEADVVVIGGGGAGLAAAISAAEANGDAKILLLEKMSSLGGNSALSGGNYGSCLTDVQLKQGETNEAFAGDSFDLYYNEKRKLGDYRSIPEVTRVFIDNCLEGYKWLQGMGIVWGRVGTYEAPIPPPENPQGMRLQAMYNVDWTEGDWIGTMTKGRHHRDGVYKDFSSGGANIAAMVDRCGEHKNIELRTNSDVQQIIREGVLEGSVLGVVVGSGAQAKKIRAKKGVIMGSGGFTANGPMCTKYDSRLDPEGPNTGVSGVTGDALLAAIDIGADTMSMDHVQIRMQRSGVSYANSIIIEGHGTYIDIDKEGNRFWKEMHDLAAYRYARLTVCYEKGLTSWWSISDSKCIEANKLTEDAIAKNIASGSSFKFDTFKELADKVGVPVDKLQATVDRYNSFVDSGVDLDFGQEKRYLKWKIDTPPFYAVPRRYYRQHTMGGVVIDPNTANVKDRRGKLIPGLYAAGEALGGVHGVERNGGCGWTECIVFGRIAGKECALR